MVPPIVGNPKISQHCDFMKLGKSSLLWGEGALALGGGGGCWELLICCAS